MTRDDFPFSLQPYATPDGGDAAADVEGWSLVLFRAADEAERAWFRDHGFTLEGRVWVRRAPPAGVAPPRSAPASAETETEAEPATGDEPTLAPALTNETATDETAADATPPDATMTDSAKTDRAMAGPTPHVAA